MASASNWLFGNPMDPNADQQGTPTPFQTPGEVGPGNVGPAQAGPTPISLGQKPPGVDPAQQQLSAPPQPPPPATNEAVKKVAAGEEAPTTSFSDWLDKNKVQSQSEWMKEKWKKAGKLGKIAMMLDAAAQGMSGFNQTYLPSQGKDPGKAYQSPYDKRYGQYAGRQKEARELRSKMVGMHQKDITTQMQAGRDMTNSNFKNFEAAMDYWGMLREGKIYSAGMQKDAQNLDLKWREAEARVQGMNENTKLNWAKFYAGQDPKTLQENLARSLASKYRDDPAGLYAETMATMKMIAETEAKSRAIGRPLGSQFPSGTHSSMQDTKYIINEDGDLASVKIKASLPTAKGKALGAQAFLQDSLGKEIDPNKWGHVFKDAKEAKKVAHFVDTTRQADIALLAAGRAASLDKDMFGIKGSDFIKTARRMSAEYGLEWVVGEQPTEEGLLDVALMNAALMHSSGQIGYRPAMQLVMELRQELSGGKTASRETKLRSIAMFKFLTEYSAAQLVTPFDLDEQTWNGVVLQTDDWVDLVLSGESGSTPPKLGNLEELMGTGYASGINWGKGKFDPSQFDSNIKQPAVIGGP